MSKDDGKPDGGPKDRARKAPDRGAGGHGTEHDGPPGRTDSDAGAGAGGHAHGSMDTSENQKVFEGMIKALIFLFGVSFLVLIFLAIFNT